MAGPAIFADSWDLKMFGLPVFPDSQVLRMVGPSVFPEKQVIPKWFVLQYFQMHELYQNGWIFSISRLKGP